MNNTCCVAQVTPKFAYIIQLHNPAQVRVAIEA